MTDIDTFRTLRAAAGLSQAKAAAYIGVTTAAVEHWEYGRRKIPRYALLAMERAAKDEQHRAEKR